MKNNILFIYLMIWFIFWVSLNNYTFSLHKSLLVLLWLVVLFLCIIFINKKIWKIIFIIITVFIWIFISNNQVNIDSYIYKKYESINNKEIELSVKILNKEKITNENIVYKWKIIDLRQESELNGINTLIYSNPFYKLNYWDIITYKSKVYKFENFDNFDYKNYMFSNKVYFKTYLNYIEEKIEKESYIKSLSLFRQKLLDNINKIYPKQEAIFLWGILLWAREELPEKLKENFNNSGLTHFIAVSGFNITIIIVFVWMLVKRVPNYVRVPLVIFSIILFSILVWITAPVLRASIMGILWYIIIQSWRNQNVLSTILLTWVIMIALSPLSINYDASFQLSFLAVLWIYYSKPYFDKKLWFITNNLEIRDAVNLTLSALVFTLPIMIFNFWQVSILSPITNVLVAWTIPISMLLGFLSILWYMLNYYIWIIIWYFAYLFLTWDIAIVNFFWELDFSILKYDFWIYSWYFQVIYFIILLFIILWNKKENP